MTRRTLRNAVLSLALVSLCAPLMAADVEVSVLRGKPQFSEGDALGYFIWIDGNTWKLRWTTFGAEHRFMGRITVDGGEFRKFKRIDPDVERKVIAPGRPGRVVRGPRGRVVGVAGGQPAVVATKEEDIVHQESETLIRFNTKTGDDLDGVEFELTPSATAVRFQLAIDGKPRPEEVELGKSNFKPKQTPLVVRIK
jgi:hypothetical protein